MENHFKSSLSTLLFPLIIDGKGEFVHQWIFQFVTNLYILSASEITFNEGKQLKSIQVHPLLHADAFCRICRTQLLTQCFQPYLIIILSFMEIFYTFAGMFSKSSAANLFYTRKG